MDIFTTQLTRVVPVPIKPATLKVKALLKDAASAKLKEDPDHLENHEYYFEKETLKEDQYHGSKQDSNEQQTSKINEVIVDDKEAEHDKKKSSGDNHLDLYA